MLDASFGKRRRQGHKLGLIRCSQCNSKCVFGKVPRRGLTSGVNQVCCLDTDRKIGPDDAVVREVLFILCRTGNDSYSSVILLVEVELLYYR